MKVILLHGNGLIAIQEKSAEIKKQFEALSVTELNGKEIDFSQASVNISTPQLFSDQRLVILTNFDSLELDKIPDDSNLTLLIKFNKALTQASTIIKEVKKREGEIIALNEKDELSVFPFLDLLGEKNNRAYQEFESLYEQYGGQYILTMLFYLLRRLAVTTKKMPSFVVERLTRQKRNFKTSQIRELYFEGLETDFKIKSGLLEEKLGLTLFISKILS